MATTSAAAVAAATTNDSLNATTKTLQQTPSTKTLGEAELRLGDLLSLTQPFKIWLNLHESNYKLPECGDILFSMSYLPTAERLTVIIIKARDLMWPAEIVVTECFVKVHLMQNNKRVQKKKTSCKRDERHPIFNESMTFMVPATSLQLRVSVIANLSPGASVGPTHPGSTYQVGHVTVGSKASGTELVHWNQTLNSLRKQTSMWHRLKK
ncbi:synaptotagmin 46 [Helobdella robusta]|uniref:Synaptotagmin 46 n=1 Tax=Helobdella robusta TaxID=6412 RepID=T1FZ56_HELRO|nr:synaptotagmin 46 [Helobdella robusta]ESN96370.1 synaptotagmin 46 [Helobdella robusta]